MEKTMALFSSKELRCDCRMADTTPIRDGMGEIHLMKILEGTTDPLRAFTFLHTAPPPSSSIEAHSSMFFFSLSRSRSFESSTDASASNRAHFHRRINLTVKQ